MTKTNQLVINYHITERCNYDCHYCYAKWEQPNELHRTDGGIEQLIDRLANYFLNDNPIRDQLGYETVRLNFAGGEPLILKRRLTSAIDYAHHTGLNTSIITNGHLLDPNFLTMYANKLDLIGISYDSADVANQINIGRKTASKKTLPPEDLINISKLIRRHSPHTALKVNTVVNRFNLDEDMTELFTQVRPEKWKVLKVLPVFSHISSISNKEFTSFVNRHQSLKSIMSVENNDTMTNSYLMIRPDGRFFQNSNESSGYMKSRSILTTPVELALKEIGFSTNKFAKRYSPSVA